MGATVVFGRTAGSSARPAGDGVVDLDVAWLEPADLDALDALMRLSVPRRGAGVGFGFTVRTTVSSTCSSSSGSATSCPCARAAAEVGSAPTHPRPG